MSVRRLVEGTQVISHERQENLGQLCTAHPRGELEFLFGTVGDLGLRSGFGRDGWLSGSGG